MYLYFHGHLENRLIYSIVIVWLHIILLLQKLLPPRYLLNMVAFMIVASASIKVSRLYGLYRHLYMQLIYWHCAVILYTHANLLTKRFWISWSNDVERFSILLPLCEGNPPVKSIFPSQRDTNADFCCHCNLIRLILNASNLSEAKIFTDWHDKSCWLVLSQQINCVLYIDVTWATCHLKSLATCPYVEQIV